MRPKGGSGHVRTGMGAVMAVAVLTAGVWCTAGCSRDPTTTGGAVRGPGVTGGAGRSASPATPGATDPADGPDTSGSGGTSAGGLRPPSRTGGASPGASPAVPRIAPARLPAAGTRHWQPMTEPQHLRLEGSFTLNECASVSGASDWWQQGFVSAQKTPAVQDVLSFTTPAAARSAYREVVADMGGCRKRTEDYQKRYGLVPDTTMRRTATAPDGGAWSRHWTGVQGISADGVQTNHIYVVRSGRVLMLLHFDEWAKNAAPAYDTRQDPAVLKSLAAGLTAR